MADKQKNFHNKLVGQAGEHLVVAELGRRGIVATPFAGNVPEIDILAYRDRRSAFIQVKAIASGTWQFNAQDYIDLRFSETRQEAIGIHKNVDASLVVVLVKVGKIYGDDAFYVLTKLDLQRMIFRGYSAYLEKHSGVRPRNAQSTHAAVSETDVVKFKDNWNLLEARLPIRSTR